MPYDSPLSWTSLFPPWASSTPTPTILVEVFLQDSNDLVFITHLLLFFFTYLCRLYYHSIKCHHYQSLRLAPAFKHVPKKKMNRLRGRKEYHAKRPKIQGVDVGIGGNILILSFCGKVMVLGGIEQG